MIDYSKCYKAKTRRDPTPSYMAYITKTKHMIDYTNITISLEEAGANGFF